ncbi:MAG: class I SAM-dependent methyltransferase [Planctomycetes bacterium]|nr:class I SAM-dependent methyltransferase [Planctomycetota bacterium]
MFITCEPIEIQRRYPNPEGGDDIFWNGVDFIDKKSAFGVLRYPMPKQPAGWSEALTDFHEEISDGRHPIDKASLETAMRNCLGFAAGNRKSDTLKILEVGCSSGLMLRRLRKELPSAEICGADIIGETLQRLSGELKAAGIPTPILQFDLTTCPLPDASFDVVVALNVLEHIKEHEIALAEIFRILKPGGIFVFEVPAGPGLYDDYDRELKHYRRYRAVELEKILIASGFVKKRLSHLAAIIFPMFYGIKKIRSRISKNKVSGKPSATSRTLIKGSGIFLFDFIFNMELWLGKFISWPFGIRCTGVFIKPDQACS